MNVQTTNDATAQAPAARKPLVQTVTGRVTSDKMDKTVTVLVERRSKHPIYGKVVIKSNKYHAHDEGNEFKPGDTVRIEETRPISKTKTWKVLDRVQAGKGVAVEADLEVEAAENSGSIRPACRDVMPLPQHSGGARDGGPRRTPTAQSAD